MATLGARRRGNAVARPFALLFVLSLLLLAFRSNDAVRVAASVGTQVLVPVQGILAQTGITTSRFVQAIGEIDRLQTENARLRTENDRLTLENAQQAERIVAIGQAAKLDAVQRALPYTTVAAPVIARDPSGVLRSIVLGAGTDRGVHQDDVVLSEQGVVGRVSEVG